MKRKKKIVFKERPPMGRIPTSPPTSFHKDESKYTRKRKHPKKGE